MTPPQQRAPLRPPVNRPVDNRAAAGGVLDVLLKPLLGAFNPPPRPLATDLAPVDHDAAGAQARAAAKRARRRERNKQLAHG